MNPPVVIWGWHSCGLNFSELPSSFLIQIIKQNYDKGRKNKREELFMYKILNDYAIRHCRPKGENTLLIRLLEPRYRQDGIPYSLEFESEYKAILNIYVDDVSEDNELARKYFYVFNEEMAKEIIEFIKAYEFDELIVHCNKEASRSAAVMIGILDYLGEEDLKQTLLNSQLYTPNPLIVQVFETYHQKLTNC